MSGLRQIVLLTNPTSDEALDLDVVVIKPMTKVELVRTYPKLFKATHTTLPQYERHRALKVLA